MAMRVEYPVCQNCMRTLAPWLERSSSGLIEPAPGRFVCYTPLCRQYGVVTWIDPRRADGEGWQVATAGWPA